MQKNSLNKKVALITGSARRVGAEIAHTLHQAGMKIVLHYNASEMEAIQLCDTLNKARENSAVALQADLQLEVCQTLIEQAYIVWERLDVLVNNASKYYHTYIGKVSEYAWDDLMNTNIKAPFFLAQAAAPYLAKNHGSIVNIADIHAHYPLKDYSVYCISKGALVTLTKVLAKELGPTVRVNAVSPGVVLWPEGGNNLSPEEKETIISRISLLRAGTPLDIAKAVLFLVRDADYVTGQVISVDGGRL